MPQGIRPTRPRLVDRLAVGTPLGRLDVPDLVEPADGAGHLADCSGGNIAGGAAAGPILPRLDRRARRRDLTVVAVAELNYAPRPLHDIVAVVRS